MRKKKGRIEMKFLEPAFPNSGFSGMTLRDWFAGQALSGFSGINDPYDSAGEFSWDPWEIARRCYDIADAMIAEKEREK